VTPEQYAEVRRLFSRAVELAPRERDDFVRKQCADDADVVREVLSLLEHHGDETILDASPQHPLTDTPHLDDPQRDVSRALASRGIAVHPPRQQLDPYLVLSEVWDENREMLRRRIIVIAVVIALMIAISCLRLLTGQFKAWGYGSRVLALGGTLLCAWFLHRKRDLTLSQIRIAELLVLANVGILLVVNDIRLLLISAAAGDEATLISVNNWHYFAWTLIIFVYGVFMPNRWQRAAAMLLPMAAIPSLVTALAAWWQPTIDRLLDEDRFGQPIPTPFAAACISIYAAHIIHGARMTAFQAKQLAQYHVKRLIGQGGMGQVYEAEHLLLKRPCAIKLILPELCSDPRALQRFEREVRASATLTHPHTIEVYDYGQTKEGLFFFAMELLPGMNLRDLVRTSGPLPPSRAVHFLVQVCGALEEAHRAGLIHRDVKPANVFASQRGGLYDFTKLLDFGVVRETQADPACRSSMDLLAGTPAYMSPEQITSPDTIDARSDLYAVGAVAYYLLTGRPPLVADAPLESMLLQLSQEPLPPSQVAESIPADLESVVMRCLRKSRDERFASAKELRTALLACHCAGRWSEEDAARWWQSLPAGA
jgi:serine/threonine-protein kinase